MYEIVVALQTVFLLFRQGFEKRVFASLISVFLLLLLRGEREVFLG